MNLFTVLLIAAVVAVVFTYVGIMLGRRSKTANALADRVQAETEHLRAEAKLKAAQAKAFLKDAGID